MREVSEFDRKPADRKPAERTCGTRNNFRDGPPPSAAQRRGGGPGGHPPARPREAPSLSAIEFPRFNLDRNSYFNAQVASARESSIDTHPRSGATRTTDGGVQRNHPRSGATRTTDGGGQRTPPGVRWTELSVVSLPSQEFLPIAIPARPDVARRRQTTGPLGATLAHDRLKPFLSTSPEARRPLFAHL